MEGIIKVAGAVFAGLFVVFWLALSWQVATLDPKVDEQPLEVGSLMVVVAGFLATTVGAQTATWMGIEIKDARSAGQRVGGQGFAPAAAPQGISAAVWSVLRRWSVPAVSCWAYLVVAVIVLLLSVFKQDNAPDFYQAFMLSGLGWLGGAFAAVSPSKTPPAPPAPPAPDTPPAPAGG